MARFTRTALALGVLALVAFQAAPSPAASPTIGKVVMNGPDGPDPQNPVSFDVDIKNVSHNSTLGAMTLDWLMIDCFGAKKGKGLYIANVFDEDPPNGGSVATQEDLVTPAIIYTGFDDGDTARFLVDPELFDASYGGQRKDFAGCRFEAAFAGPKLRGSGVLKLKPSGNLVAELKQVNP